MPKTKLTAIIIDDEPEAIEQLAKLLEETDRVKILETFTGTQKALIGIIKHRPDLLFSMCRCPCRTALIF